MGNVIWLRILVLAVAAVVLLCGAAGLLSVLSNRRLPSGPTVLDRLDPLDQARLAEALHLKLELGENVWPGWGQIRIPIVLWNHRFSFLTGAAGAPAGWEPVPGDTFIGQPYYRRRSANPQNFATQLGGSSGAWAASMATKWETDAFLIAMFDEMLPAPLDKVFPYRLVIQPSEVQISGVLHETFHVYQVQIAPGRLGEAEQVHQRGQAYWAADGSMRTEWRSEIDLLARALKATSDERAADLARRFLAQREARRQMHSLETALVGYERQLEWEEGLAKYVELEIWCAAHTNQAYEPLPAMGSDPDFRQYTTFRQRWSQEIDQMRRQASREGEPRFYYTGMAQAVLLDRLLPGWKERIWSDGTWLETLLAEAVTPS